MGTLAGVQLDVDEGVATVIPAAAAAFVKRSS
jgi:hypothetical protein